MNEERLRERIEQLTQDKENLYEALLVTEGAIKDCEYWLAILKSDE